MTVWKFPFEVQDEFSLSMPRFSRILTVQMQGDQPCIWAAVEPSESRDERRFRILGTGRPTPISTLEYVGTFQMFAGALVWHLFEVKP